MRRLSPVLSLLLGTLLSGLCFGQSQAVLPTSSQEEWAGKEIGVMITLDLNVYVPDTYRYETRSTLPSVSVFNPSHLNTDQWIRSAREAGARYAVLVAKHGTGFCLWPTREHGYSVKNTPWEGGQGDIVADFIRSCKKYGVKPGIYYSTGSNAYYGNHNGTFDSPDSVGIYNKMVLAQLKELYGGYGKLFEIWYDGGVTPSAKGGISDEVTQLVLRYQDKAILFQGPAACFNLVRWVGNENGKAPYPMWSRADTTTASNGVVEIKGLNGNPDGPIWCPAETDVPLRLNSAWEGGWLWHAGQDSTVRPLRELVDLYYSSVGNNTNMILGMVIDTSGRFPERDSTAFSQFGKEIARRFAKPIPTTGGSGKEYTLSLGKFPVTVNQVVLSEDISRGENIRQYAVQALMNGQWETVATGISVGHKRIQAFKAIKTNRMRLTIQQSEGTPFLKSFAVYDVTENPL